MTRIRRAIEQRLLANPLQSGEPLRKGLKGYRKLRVGDYRVIYEIHTTEIRIYTIGHRKEIYETRLREWQGVHDPVTPKVRQVTGIARSNRGAKDILFETLTNKY